MGLHKMFSDDFTNERRLSWIRSRAQATYRGEPWNLSWEEYCQFWRTEELWRQRGRSKDDLVLTRYDVEGSWDRDNCCIITRYNHLLAKIYRRQGKDIEEYFKDAIWYGQR